MRSRNQPAAADFVSLPYCGEALPRSGKPATARPRKLGPYQDQAGSAAGRSGRVSSNRALTFAIDCCLLNRGRCGARESKMCAKHHKLLVGTIFLAVMSLGCEGRAQNLTTRTTGCLGSGGNFSLFALG